MTGDLGWDEYADTVSPLGLTNLNPLGEAPKGTFRYIRIHNMFSGPEGDHRGSRDAGGHPVKIDNDGNYYYDWTSIDKVLQAILDVNCVPFLELGFTPNLWSSIPEGEKVRYKENPTPMDEVENPLSFYPPKDYALWADLVNAFLLHIEEKFGDVVKEWPTELWNEPDILYFKGTLDQYCELWKLTYNVCKKHGMKTVGAPSVARTGPFLTGVLEYSVEHDCRLDFISYHVKGGSAGNSEMSNPILIWGKLLEGRDRIQALDEYKDTPIYITEIDPLVGCEFGIPDRPNLEWRNESYYASWLGKMCYLIASMQRGWEYGENEPDESIGPFFCHAHFNDAHHVTAEHQTFYGARCLTTPVWIKDDTEVRTSALKKPIFRAFEYTRFLEGSYIPFADFKQDVFGMLAYNDDILNLCVVVHNDRFNEGQTAEVNLRIENLPHDVSEIVKSVRIDSDSANPYEAWKALGSPKKIDPNQYEQLLEASKPKNLKLYDVVMEENIVEISFNAKKHSFNFIRLK